MPRSLLTVGLIAWLCACTACNDDPPSQAEEASDTATTDHHDATDVLPDSAGPVDAATDGSRADTSLPDVTMDADPSDVGPVDTHDDAPTRDTHRDLAPDVPRADAPATDAPTTDAGVPGWRVCSQSSDCTLAKDNCCGWCGTATLSDLDPVHRNKVSDQQNDVCNDPNPICPLCAQGPIPDGLRANCQSGVCHEIDLRPFQSCMKDEQCRVRTLDCCEDCQADTNRDALVAINRNDASQVKQALCPTPSPTCANCPVTYPSDVSAVCNNNGRCVLK